MWASYRALPCLWRSELARGPHSPGAERYLSQDQTVLPSGFSHGSQGAARKPCGSNGDNSCGLGLIGSEGAAGEAQELTAPGFRAVKVRLGYPDVKTDLDVVRRVRDAVGADILLMSSSSWPQPPESGTRSQPELALH